MDKVLGLMTPFMKKELQNVLSIHSDLEDFYKYIPKDMLPKEIGGDLMESKDLRGKKDRLRMKCPLKNNNATLIFIEILYNTLRENREDILQFEREHLIDEAKRPGESKSASDLFGVEGSFKKLDID